MSAEQIRQAKRVNLYDYLTHWEPHLIYRTSPNEIRLREHDSLNITPSGKWHWHSQGVGGIGNPINFFMIVFKLDFPAAVERLCSAPARSAVLLKAAENDRKEVQEIVMPKCRKEPQRVIKYLTEQRGIDADILAECVEQKRLRETVNYSNCLFLGFDSTGWMRYGATRGTTGTYHGELEGSDKRFGFCLPASRPDADTVVVAEAAIDALSLATLDKLKHGEELRQGRHYLALGGTSPLALMQFLSDRPEVREVVFCLDADSAGTKGTEAMAAAILDDAALNRQIHTLTDRPPPWGGMDYNDILLAHRGHEQAQRRFQVAAGGFDT